MNSTEPDPGGSTCKAHCTPKASSCGVQEAARLMAAGDYESALPVALEAVAIGEKLFKPQPALQLFPLYLLAAQVCIQLGMST